ncbi:Cytochrome P450 CYP2 subfamily [Handroanthus impetiginosus]|uniref:Cytochrome P450 CYP2 subfamily n=1 Tax=Handroanthus impetiginosus TaxID=429701 RepID=A0A2G9GR86_9LAMI|nr:Cytochrome P450 CYP2 subfamily [Handroanthus impetiginosus]
MDLLLLRKTLIGLFAALASAVIISKLRRKRLNLPPGPFSLPLVGSWLQIGNNLDQHDFKNYAKKFGDLFLLRMGTRSIAVISSKDVAKEVLLTQGKEFGSRSRNIVFDIFTGKGQDLVFSEYGEHWRKMRRIVTVPFFTNKVVQHYRANWEAEAAALVDDVRNNPAAATEGIVLRHRLELMVYNNVYKIMCDKRFQGMDDPLFVKLKSINGERSRLGQSLEYNFGDFVPFFRPFLRRYLKICREVTRRRLNFYKNSFIEERKEIASTRGTEINNNGLKCGIDHFLEAQQKGEINEDHVLYIVENMNVAAIETTIWAFEWTIAELINNPKIQTKLRTELDTILGPGHQITEPDTYKLPYLHAVIKESLRLRMVVPCLVPHMNVHQAKLRDYDIPPECRIYINAWWLANDPAHWKKPEEFRPERFLEEEANIEANGNDMKYIPFGVGRRSCPGISIALPVLGITLGRLVQNFELLPPPGQEKIDTMENNGQFAMRMRYHANIVLKPRSFD